MVGGDERLVAAHDKAVREALAEAENYAANRVRLHGANEDRTTGNWIEAAYGHDTSRELDPQLHTHAVAANLTYDGVEGRTQKVGAAMVGLPASVSRHQTVFGGCSLDGTAGRGQEPSRLHHAEDTHCSATAVCGDQGDHEGGLGFVAHLIDEGVVGGSHGSLLLR